MSRLQFERSLEFAYGCPVSGSSFNIAVGNVQSGSQLNSPAVYRFVSIGDGVYLNVGLTGSAEANTTTSLYLPEGVVEYFSTLTSSMSSIRTGEETTDANYLSVIRGGSVDCTLNVTLMSGSHNWIQ